MSKSLLFGQMVFGACVALLGLILFFCRDVLLSVIPAASYLIPVNQTVFDSLKMFIAPFLLVTIAEWSVFGRKMPNFFPAKAIALWIGIAFYTVMLYTYRGIFGKSLLLSDLLCFAGAITLAYIASGQILLSDDYETELAGLFGRIGLSIAFVFLILFSYVPPRLPMFLG